MILGGVMAKIITENNSFIYIWFNKVKKMFYIGKHYGAVDDGYVCSSKMMLIDYNRNPEHFKRRVLEFVDEKDGSQSLDAESKWLSLIPDEQLGKKYYNLKNKNFGNTRGHKKSYVWNAGLSKSEQKEYLELRKNRLFCLLTEKPKRGIFFKPVIQYNCEICGKYFESKNTRKFCSATCSAKKIFNNDVKEKMSKAKMGKPAWNKGIENPTAAENGRKSADKQSQTVTGRKLFIREDGSRTWIYPNRSEQK